MSSLVDSMKYSLELFNDNVFFCEGSKHILAKQKNERCVFIQFEALFVRKILSVDFSVYSSVKFILICDNIEAVFYKKMKVKHILRAMNSSAEMKRLMKEVKKNNHIFDCA